MSGAGIYCRVVLLLLSVRAGECAADPFVQRALLLEPTNELLQVTEMIRVEDARAHGVVQVYVPKSGVDSLQAIVREPDGRTAEIAIQPTRKPDIFRLRHPAKAGASVFEIRYATPLTDSFSGKTPDSSELRLVSRSNVNLLGKNVRFLSREPRSQDNLYELVGIREGDTFEVNIEAAPQRARERQPQRGPARVYDRLSTLVVLTCTLLCAGGALMYRSDSPSGSQP